MREVARIKNRPLRGRTPRARALRKAAQARKNAANVKGLVEGFFELAVKWHNPPVSATKEQIYKNARSVMEKNLCRTELERELFPIIDRRASASGKKMLDVISKHYPGKNYGEIREIAGNIFSSLARRIGLLNSVSSELSPSMTEFPGIERNIFNTLYLDYNINFYKSKFSRRK